jgi:DNA-binding MurR/RpiR family transcriptional regulator
MSKALGSAFTEAAGQALTRLCDSGMLRPPVGKKANSTSRRGLTPDGLASRVEQLSRKRRELIRPALEAPREFVLLSVRALAKRLNTDPATAVRIVRGMGFDSYRAFQRYLHELSIVRATSLDTMRSSGAKDSSIPAHVRESLDQDLKNLNALRHSLDFKRIIALADRLYSANRILLLGGDLAASLVSYLEYHMTILGLPVLASTTTGRTMHVVRTIGKKDVVIAISFRRGLRQTVEGMQHARSNKAYCVGITDTYVSPVVRFSDEFFLASVESPSFGASYVAPVALLNVILVACANYRRARTLALLREADEEQRHGFRWYEQ